MKKYAFSFRGQEDFEHPIAKHNFLLRCMPGTYPFQRSYAHRLTVTPYAALTHITDVFGNEMYTGAIDKKHRKFSFEATGFVLCSKYLIHEPLDRLYLYPSRLTRPTEGMGRVLAQASLSEEPWTRAQQLCDLVHRTMTFVPITAESTAAGAFASGKGDAKDLSHVLMALCRSTGIAARMVSGLAVGVSQAHCWTEVYCGSVWRALDPTTGLPAEDGYLKIAQGQDFSACALFREIYREDGGAPAPTISMAVQVTEHVITTRDTVPHA